jgi:hypothetical protein
VHPRCRRPEVAQWRTCHGRRRRPAACHGVRHRQRRQARAGIFTAIIAGFLIAALGGSRVQIGGPAGAFIVIIYGIIEKYGLANLLISTACAGVLLFAMGLARLGQPGPLHSGVDRDRLHQRHRGADRAVAGEGLPRA